MASIGVPSEIKVDEQRVALTPDAVRELVTQGLEVRVQSGAGAGAGISDEAFAAAGARVVTRDEAWAAHLVVKVKEPQAKEFAFLRDDMVLFTYLHLAAYPKVGEALLDAGTTGVAYETVQLENGSLPLLAPMSEIAGRLAAQVGAHLLEQFAGIPTSVFYASEFRYSPPPLAPHTLTIGVTQSGETADTLAALAMEAERRAGHGDPAFASRQLGITNRAESSLARQVDAILDIGAGIEVGVAATKTFLGQLLAFYGLALAFTARRGSRDPEEVGALVQELRGLPAQLQALVEAHDARSAELAPRFADTQDVIFLGRGINYPIALEGALKLKEISYIHAEGYPAGEMKHGPIALLDSRVPVVSIAVPGVVFEKVLSNAQEAKARDARLIGVAPSGPDTALFDDLLEVPAVSEWISPLLTVVPMQLLSYHIAAHRGLDVDQPRNLAKSVTVE